MREEDFTAGLAPCPFCGGAGKLIPLDVTDLNMSTSSWRVGCMMCLALGPPGGQGSAGRTRATLKWNERSKRP